MPTDLPAALPLRPVDLGGGLVIRPLSFADLPRLIGIFAGDPAMNWSMSSWGPDNVEFVLNLRLQHYQRYGFGLYAVETHGSLVGWAGLQFEKQEDPQAPGELEVVSFIARSSWGQGITTKVWTWALDRAFEAGVQQVTSATRPENRGGEAATKRMGFTRDGTDLVEHWGFPAKHWKLTRDQWQRQHSRSRTRRLTSRAKQLLRPRGQRVGVASRRPSTR